MKKKGVVYRMTMIFGAAFIIANMGGETAYALFMKQTRTQQLQDEKKKKQKMDDIGEDDEAADDGSIVDKINPMASREKYREDRLNRIKKSREEERQVAPTREELSSQPSLREIRERPLVKRDDKLHLDKEDKDAYM